MFHSHYGCEFDCIFSSHAKFGATFLSTHAGKFLDTLLQLKVKLIYHHHNHHHYYYYYYLLLTTTAATTTTNNNDNLTTSHNG